MVAAFLFNSHILHIGTTHFVNGGCGANEEVSFPDNTKATTTLNCNTELPLLTAQAETLKKWLLFFHRKFASISFQDCN